MRYKLRLPRITGKTEKEKLEQIVNYLHQLAGDLQFVINNIADPSGNTSGQPDQTARPRVAGLTKQTEEKE